MSKNSFFTIEEADIVKLEASDDAQVRKGWINVGTHAVLLELDENGQLTVEVRARTNEGRPLAQVIVTEDASVKEGGNDPDKLPLSTAYDDMSEAEKTAFDARQGISSSDRDLVETRLTGESCADANTRTRFVKVDFEGIIEITHEDKFGKGFKVFGPADDDRYTVRFIATAEEAIKVAQTQAELKANDAGGPVMVESYIGMKPIQDKVFPTA